MAETRAGREREEVSAAVGASGTRVTRKMVYTLARDGEIPNHITMLHRVRARVGAVLLNSSSCIPPSTFSMLPYLSARGVYCFPRWSVDILSSVPVCRASKHCGATSVQNCAHSRRALIYSDVFSMADAISLFDRLFCGLAADFVRRPLAFNRPWHCPFSTASASATAAQDLAYEEAEARLKCDPYEQGGKPLPRADCDSFLARLDMWKILDLAPAAAPPPIQPNFATGPPPPASAGDASKKASIAGGCGSSSCACAAASLTACSSSASTVSTAAPAAPSAPAASAASPVTGSGANARRFKGGLVLRREWLFRTVQAGMDFVEQIQIISTNRAFSDALSLSLSSSCVCFTRAYLHCGCFSEYKLFALVEIIIYFATVMIAVESPQRVIRPTVSLLMQAKATAMSSPSSTRRDSAVCRTMTFVSRKPLTVHYFLIASVLRPRHRRPLIIHLPSSDFDWYFMFPNTIARAIRYHLNSDVYFTATHLYCYRVQ
jgi:hypothetical protein